MIYFISGHRDIKEEEFKLWYEPRLEDILGLDTEARFVVGDCKGVDQMAQAWLKDHILDKTRVTVYHMLEKPRVLEDKDFNTIGGFKGDIERDTAMTLSSDMDIAFIGKGRWTSGTAQNILRRYERDRL